MEIISLYRRVTSPCLSCASRYFNLFA